MAETLRTFAHSALLLSPVTVVVILVIGAALTVARPAWTRRWLLGTALLYWFLSTSMGNSVVSAPLAYNFRQIQTVGDTTGAGAIVVLGGGTYEVRDGPHALAYLGEGTALRTVEGARVFHMMGGRPIVVASGGMPMVNQTTPEADLIAEGLKRLKVPAERIVLERESLTTRDEAVFVTEMLARRGIRRFVLVTSPTHMRRAVAAFRAQRADVVPSVARLRSEDDVPSPWFVPTIESMRHSNGALYDYGALMYYWMRGWLQPMAVAG